MLRALAIVAAFGLVTLSAHAEPDEECLLVENAFAQNQLDVLAGLELSDPYWQALKQFRLAAIHIPEGRDDLARRAVLDGLAIVNPIIKANPEGVEMLLLGAMLDGQILLLSPWRFFHNGRRGLKRLNTAEELAPDNPRATLVRGTALVVLPGIFGGDAAEARDRFVQTLAREDASGQRFDQSQLCADSEWAQVDLLNWLGRAHDKLGQAEGARGAYARALERSPGNHWVRLAIDGRGYDWSGE